MIDHTDESKGREDIRIGDPGILRTTSAAIKFAEDPKGENPCNEIVMLEKIEIGESPSNSSPDIDDARRFKQVKQKGVNSDLSAPEPYWQHWNRHWHDWQHHHHLWSSRKLPRRSSDAHALARAEAASWAQMTPLIAATLGPLAILLGIPSLTQRWEGQVLDPPELPNGTANVMELADPTINVVLAIVCLFCEVLGNALLVLRFSNFQSKAMTWGSYAFWVAKIIIGLVNYIQFGITHPETGDIMYLQGFWVSSHLPS